MAQVSETMLKMFAPAPYDGKDCAQALAYLARAKTFFNHLPATFSKGEKFMLLLNLLQDKVVIEVDPVRSGKGVKDQEKHVDLLGMSKRGV